MILRFKHFILLAVLMVITISFVSAQETTNKPEKKTDNKPQTTDLSKGVTAEQVAETAIILYGTRDNLSQIRKSVFERGKINITNVEGKVENGKV